MNVKHTDATLVTSLLSKKIAAVRIIFGVVWAVDAAFKFQPTFFHNHNLITYIKAIDSGLPSWTNPWFHFWFRIIGAQPTFFAFFILVAEVLIAASLLFGIARRLNYALAIPFCFLIWTVGENFGGPYTASSTDIGAGFIYVVVFLLLFVVDGPIAPSWSLDSLLEKRFSWWAHLSSPLASIRSTIVNSK